MLMGKKVVLAVLVIAVAFGAEAEFQGWVILLRAAADGAPMSGGLDVSFYLLLEGSPSLYLSGSHMNPVLEPA